MELPSELPEQVTQLWYEYPRGINAMFDRGNSLSISVNGVTVTEPGQNRRFVEWSHVRAIVPLPDPSIARIVTDDDSIDLGPSHGPFGRHASDEEIRQVRRSLLQRAFELAHSRS